MSLSKKIDFALVFSVDRANPNGDPLNGNRPRIDYEGYGEVSDVCLKRKIRDRLVEDGYSIFVQSDQKKIDGMPSLRKRAESADFGLGKEAFDSKKTKAEDFVKKACGKWLDVRTFGQLFAFGNDNKGGVSIPIRGPMTIQSAFSVEPVSVASIQITKSVSGDGDGSKRGSDTMGMKHRVDHGIYVTYGAISPQLAERTGFSDEDAEVIKRVLPKIFEGDASSARPEGSMSVIKVLWWEHSSKMGSFSSAKVHGTLTVNPDGSYEVDSLEGISLEEIDGF
ncbi:CRISPR-associated protein, Csd2 family [Dethiosulfovibrio peptidovorans DSM 11002]|uniref:CRISPR-associated protein, Csd2 family n=1 Tax=Dethiosulfovibrio peptidovorans DSM 11002 TaxID=469381 RepID=D2Z6K2_9BACT|nr:type I-C CRISPR-associated protein Cas7/Csd2 [Dethiosulfovibrio peptidovorans]EFC91099.1 CRISPR-associated protein, Csd2 family [Dethiosulfovibrio peptidovorans DSM 11002]